METLTKYYPFALKESDPDEGTFEGIASAYGVVDSDNEVVDRGAFAKTVRESAHRIKLYYNHGWLYREPPIGKALELRDEADGLYIRGRIAPTARGIETLTLAREGVISELSIGARVVKAVKASDGRRHFKELALREVSLVDVAANPSARITEVKAERLLRELHDLSPSDISPEMAKAAIEALQALLAEPQSEHSTAPEAAAAKADEPVIDHSLLLLGVASHDLAALARQLKETV